MAAVGIAGVTDNGVIDSGVGVAPAASTICPHGGRHRWCHECAKVVGAALGTGHRRRFFVGEAFHFLVRQLQRRQLTRQDEVVRIKSIRWPLQHDLGIGVGARRRQCAGLDRFLDLGNA